MEDFILREIDKIGQLIRSLMEKLHLVRRSGEERTGYEKTKVELGDSLNMNLETLLGTDDPAEALVTKHGFSSNDLELFAELLADLAAAAEDRAKQIHLASAACAIYRYQEAHKAPVSLNRYYILKELAQYNR